MTTFIFSEEDIKRTKKVADIITSSLATHLTIQELAQKVKLPKKKLKYAFKHFYGLGIYSYLQYKRMEKAKELMLAGMPIKLIILEIGYTDEANFNKAFKKVFKQPPIAWKKSQMIRTG